MKSEETLLVLPKATPDPEYVRSGAAAGLQFCCCHVVSCHIMPHGTIGIFG
jgi:hypothetical protein